MRLREAYTKECLEYARTATSQEQRALFGAKISKGDGVSKLGHARDTMLPFRAHHALQQIGGSRRKDDRGALPGGAYLPTQAKITGRQERDSHDIAEHGAVLVPTNGRSWSIFRQQHLLQVGGL